MPQEEMFGTRDMEYSVWHRASSISRFIGNEEARRLLMCDIDTTLFIEYRPGTRLPLALIETARDHGQTEKDTTIIRVLAERAGIEALLVLYTFATKGNPADKAVWDIKQFRVKMIHPPETTWRVYSPKEYAEFLVGLRSRNQERIDRMMGVRA